MFFLGVVLTSFLQDVTWFDLKEVAALPAEINDDLEILHIELGEISHRIHGT